ncbi:MAG TPA: DNA polymerase IV, partial [Acidimicrobiales bacterium]|nr:DNA polymerase IV [Acidimicrobiales bacterium]
RIHGVRSAMPSVQARRRCPGAVFRPPRHDRYQEVSRSIHEVFLRYTPLVEGVALDEAFLDVTGAQALFGPPAAIAAAIRAAITDELHLACSVGIGPSKLVAKLASEAAKPRAGPDGVRPGPGVVEVGPGEVEAFLRPLPVEALWGVGPATAERLHGLGITTVGRLAATPVAVLEQTVGRHAGRHLHGLAQGVDLRPVEPDRAVKSIGHEETFGTDRWDPAELRRELVRMGDGVASRLRRAGLAGRTVQLKVRMGDFTTITRARTLPSAVDTGPTITALAWALLEPIDIDRGVRLLGVSVSSLEAAVGRAEQLALDFTGGAPGSGGARAAGGSPSSAAADGPPPLAPAGSAALGGPDAPDAARVIIAPVAARATAGAVDAIRARFGPQAVLPATLAPPPGPGRGGSSSGTAAAVPGNPDRRPRRRPAGPDPDGP